MKDIISQAPVAIGILQGEDMVIEHANASMLELWGKTDQIIGLKLLDALPEIREQVFPQLLNEVYQSGQTYHGNEMKVLINRNGPLEECYFNFVYSVVKDDSGQATGVMVIASEVTAQIRARNELEKSEQRFRNLILDAPMATALYAGEDMVIRLANEAMLKLWGKDASVIGKKLEDALPELQGQPFLKLLQNVYASGIAYQTDESRADLMVDGELRTFYFNFTYKPLFDAAGRVYAIMNMAVDITAQVQARRVLQESERHWQYMTNAMPQQVWTATSDGQLNFVNHRVCQYFGASMDEIVGSGWQQFIHPDDLTECLTAWQEALQNGSIYSIEFRLRDADGNYKWHLGRALPMKNYSTVIQWFGTNTDINDQKLSEQKKDEFLSIASHELKTPLTSIKAYNQLMQRDHSLEKIQALVNKSTAHISRLERLISDLLDVTKINAGKMVYNMQDFDFNEVLVETIESVQYTSPKHRIILENSVHLMFRGDRLRIEQVLNNFINNAVKYSPQADRVIVTCCIQDHSVVVSVQDFGIGIPQADLGRLFERYYRSDNSLMRFEGLGLGLYIASEILRRHHGNFWIESQPGEGSVFSFRLPLGEEQQQTVVKKPDTCYEDQHLRISFNFGNDYLEADWRGFQTLESVKRGCMAILKCLKDKKCHRLLNDNSNILGSWSEAAEWAAKESYPQLEHAGIRCLAWIVGSNTFSQLSAKKSIELADVAIETCLFTDRREAESWLKSQP